MNRHVVFALISLLSLTSCSISGVLDDAALKYNDTIEDVVDKLLVLNILRARDNAPLHFGDIASIHESLQVSASVQSSFPIGPINHSTTRGSVTPNVSVQEAPTFDLSNLDAKDFITGLMAPIDPYVVKYWLDRGLDKRLVLLLFFSAIEITTKDSHGELQKYVFHNAPRISAGRDELDEFKAYLTLVNRIATVKFTANSYSEAHLISAPFSMKIAATLKDVTAIDTSKYELAYGIGSKHYALYSASTEKKVAFCVQGVKVPLNTEATAPVPNGNPCVDAKVYTSATKVPTEPDSTSSTKQAKADDTCSGELKDWLKPGELRDWLDKCPAERLKIKFYIRSVGDIVHFLGDILRPHEGVSYPVTLGFCYPPLNSETSCNGGYLFQLPTTPQPSARFAVSYRGETHYVGADNPADHTLQVLAIVNQLLNLNKSATDLRSTPFVQVLP